MTSFTSSLEKVVADALALARQSGAGFATVEHLLVHLIDDPEASFLLRAAGVDRDMVRQRALALLRSDVVASEQDRVPDVQFQQVLRRATVAAKKANRSKVDGSDVLVSLAEEEGSRTADLLRELGLHHANVSGLGTGISANFNAIEPAAKRPAPRTITAPAAPKSAAAIDSSPAAPVDAALADQRDPLSPRTVRLNGHVNYLDPRFGVSFPTLLVPDPVTEITDRFVSGGLGAAVAARAAHVCHYCGLRSLKYQRVVGPLSTITATEAHLACIFCAQVMALDIASRQNSGVLVHLPEFGQAELHAYARIIYVARISQGQVADEARRALDTIMARRTVAKAHFGTDDPYHLAIMLAGCRTPAEMDALTRRLQGIRLFPLDRRNISEGELKFNQFPQILAYSRSKDGPFGGLLPSQMDLSRFHAKFAGLAATG